MNHGEIVSFLWGVADLIRDTFRRGRYQDVILPLTVLRRVDCVLTETKEKVLARQAELRDRGLENLDRQLRMTAGLAFYNTSLYDFDKLIADAPNIAANLRNYIAGFSQNMREVIAFLNTDGGDLLIGVADNGSIVGIEADQLDNDDKFMRHLAQVVRNGLGDRTGTCIDPKTQVVQGKTVCVVSCQRSPEPVFLKWKGVEATPEGDFFVRQGPGTIKLPPDSAKEYIRTRWPGTRTVVEEVEASGDLRPIH